MPNDNPVRIDSVDKGRQAVAALKGYQHQLYATALAWARLPAHAALLVEVAEDYAIVVDEAVKAVQVKSGAARPTLRLGDCVDFINAFWRLRSQNPDRKVEALFLSTANAGHERGVTFPDGLAGLDYWRRAARENADVEPIRVMLLELPLEPALLAWLQTAADEEVRRTLLMPVRWECGTPTVADLDPLLIDAILDAGEALALLPSDAERVKDAMLAALLNLAGSKGLRSVTRIDFLKILEIATTVSMSLSALRRGVGGTPLPRISGAVAVTDIDRPPDAIPRAATVANICQHLADTGCVWLHGATGLGKTNLALETGRQSNRDWKLIGLRGMDAEEVRRRLIDARLAARESNFGGLVLDDLPDEHLPAVKVELSILAAAVRRADGALICTCYRPAAPSFALGSLRPALVEAPYLSDAEVAQMVTLAGGDAQQWASLVSLFAGGGHPQLVAARIAGLKFRGWPMSERMAGLDPHEPLVDVEAERESVRRRLLHELPPAAAGLLYRLSACAGHFDRQSALAIGRASPPLPSPGTNLDILVGPWIETVGRDRYRTSPLVADAAEKNLSPDEITAINRALVDEIILRRPFPGDRLGQLLTASLRAKHRAGLGVVAMATLQVEGDDRAYLARDLIVLAHLRTDRPIFPDELHISAMLRLAQLRVAIFAETKNVAVILETLFAETQGLDEGGDELCVAAVGSVLTADTNALPSAQWIPLLTKLPNEPKASPKGAKDWSLRHFAFVWRATHLKSVANLQALFEVLDGLEPALRDDYLSALRDPLIGVRALVQEPWVDDAKQPDFDGRAVAAVYDGLGQMAERWGEQRIQIECVGCQAVLLSEYAEDHTGALALLDAAALRWPEEPRLVREVSKILLRIEDYAGALARLRVLVTRIPSGDIVDRVYVYRELAVSAAYVSEFATAADAFDKGHEAVKSTRTLKAKSAGLLADRAFIEFRMGDRERAARTLHAVLIELDALDPEDRRVEYALRMVGHLLQWMINKIEPEGASDTHTEATFGFCSRDPPEYEWPTPLMPIEGLWYQLEELEGALGADLGFAAIVEARVQGRRNDFFEMRRASRAMQRAVIKSELGAFIDALPGFCTAWTYMEREGRGALEANLFEIRPETSWAAQPYNLAEPSQRRFALHAAVGFLGVARLGQARDYIEDMLTALADAAASAPLAPLLRGETSPAPDSAEFGELRVLSTFDMLSGDQLGGTLLLFQSSYLAWRWLQGGAFKKAASGCFAHSISIRWQWALDHALFDLRQPSRTAAPIAEVCKQPPGYHQLARLVLAAEPAVHFNLSEAGRTALREASLIDEP